MTSPKLILDKPIIDKIIYPISSPIRHTFSVLILSKNPD